jgi:hypothetical protein
VQEFEQELTKESNAVFQTLFQDENVMKTNGNKKRGGGMKKTKSKAVKEKTTTEEASIDDDDEDSNKVNTKGMNASLSYPGGSRNDANDFSTLDSEDDDSFFNEEDFLVAALSSDVSLPKSREETDDSTTVLLTPIQVAATNIADITQDKDSSWKQVKSKRAVRKTETKMSEEHETRACQDEIASGGKLQQNEAKAVSDLDAKESQHDNEEEAGNQDFDCVPESWSTEKAVPTETMSAQHTERPPISSNENHPKSIATNTDTDTIATMTTSSQTQFEQDPMQTIQTLHQQVQQLQAQLAQRQELLLTQERQAHSKVLQQYEERMQALQLKCFISETRSRAFEEALEQHVATVANNVALLMTPRKFSNETNAAPLLDDVSTGDTTTTIATKTNNKPLYSRATSKNLNNTNN